MGFEGALRDCDERHRKAPRMNATEFSPRSRLVALLFCVLFGVFWCSPVLRGENRHRYLDGGDPRRVRHLDAHRPDSDRCRFVQRQGGSACVSLDRAWFHLGKNTPYLSRVVRICLATAVPRLSSSASPSAAPPPFTDRLLRVGTPRLFARSWTTRLSVSGSILPTMVSSSRLVDG